MRLRPFAVACSMAAVALGCAACDAPQSPSRPAPGSLISAPPSGGVLSAVACIDTQTCWAVGHGAGDPRAAQPVLERSYGTRWVSAAGAPTSPGTALLGVACTSTADCWAVGGPVVASSGSAPLIEHYDGTAWSLSAAPPSQRGVLLHGVACKSVTNCWAVGATNGPSSRAVIDHWDGSAWTEATSPESAAVPSPVPAADDAVPAARPTALNAVTCARAGTCWAVGTPAGGALIERNDGSGWTAASPAPDRRSVTLTGVACADDPNCWAVGYAVTPGHAAAVIEHGVDSAWTTVASPAPIFSTTTALSAVTCAKAAGCWATGSATSASASSHALVEQLAGARWELLPTPPVDNRAALTPRGVSCSDEDDCWVVGGCISNAAAPCAGSASLIEFYDTILPDGH